MRMESEESSSNDEAGFGDDTKTLITGKNLEDLRRDAVLAHQEITRVQLEVKQAPGSTLQLLGDKTELREASARLTNEAKKSDLDVIVRARITAMVGLLNIYADENLKFSWRQASEIVAKA